MRFRGRRHRNWHGSAAARWRRRLSPAPSGLDVVRESRIIPLIRTVIETPTFQKQAQHIGSDAERFNFINWIAANPDAGDVIPGADGARKVRWKRAGIGKSDGARVIYFNLIDEEVVLLVAVYAKAERENMLPKDIRKVL